jgi:predicted ATPase
MLTMLKVSGFKNLVDVEVRFGPFTCIAGPNGVGKSNLFDAILFLSALADHPLREAAMFVRDGTADIKSLFHRTGKEHTDRMRFEAEMIVPDEGIDDLGQTAKATITFLRYTLELGYREDPELKSGTLTIIEEDLTHITLRSAAEHLLFPHSAKEWRDSAIKGRRAGSHFISTDSEGGNPVIKMHQDRNKRGGRPLKRLADTLPRTVLSVANAAESPTALLARSEMQSWRLLQLEPSALRKPDEFSAPTKLGADGSHLPSTLYRLARQEEVRNGSGNSGAHSESRVYTEVANRLSLLIEGIHSLWVDRDEGRKLLTLHVMERDRTPHAARDLSDGTLRFLALSVLCQDRESQGIICLEEPENGIHPARIPAMIDLLQEITVNSYEPVGSDNPLRQVIINTHSPSVVQQVPDDSLLVAELAESMRQGTRFKSVRFSCLPETWRVRKGEDTENQSVCPKGKLLAYLNPVLKEHDQEESELAEGNEDIEGRSAKTRRVVDRLDIQHLLPFPPVKQA